MSTMARRRYKGRVDFPIKMGDPTTWSCNDISDWLKDNGFQKYSKLLCVDHQIDGQALLNLTENDLKQPPIEIHVIGDVKRMMLAIQTLRTKATNSSGRKNGLVVKNGFVPIPSERVPVVGISVSDSDFSDLTLAEPHKHFAPERNKAALSILYFVSGMYATCYSIVIAQGEAPDQQKHPPLPDIFLDHFPQVSWAYRVSDMLIITLTISWTVIVFFHKHRWILVRRTFCLMGSMYFLRCACILITHLPVPESNVTCDRRNYTSLGPRLGRALEIFFGAGLKVSGLRTCGDYMFSGHTVTLTLFNFFITEYTPKKYCLVHIFSWVANLFGMFFILAGHGHYSIDVFVAFVLTSRLFLYYHAMASHVCLTKRDSTKHKLWFPVFSYFEANAAGEIPYKFDWPLTNCWTKVKNYLRGYQLVSSKD